MGQIDISTYTLVRKANPRKKDTRLYDIETSNLLRDSGMCMYVRQDGCRLLS